MRARVVLLGLACALLVALPMLSQGNPTGKLSGKVTNEGQPIPGVTVTVTSPNLQGSRTTTTSGNGDYLFPSLPPGEYTVTFELQGMQTVTQNLRVSAAQSVPLDVAMSVAGLTEEIVVTGTLEAISQGTQAATTYTKTLVDALPVGRTVNEIVALSPGVQATGPAKDTNSGLGNITISGAPSFENLFVVNGVVVNENVRGQALDLFIEDAIQETTTASAAISAEYGRFSGGVVNVITKSGGNDFSGSLRTSFINQDWEAATPLTITQTDKIVPTYEATLGGPILRDRLWFFAAGRDRERSETRNTASQTNIPYENVRDQQRYEGKLTATITPRHTLLGSYSEIDDQESGNATTPILDLDSLVTRETPQELWSINYTGTLTDNLLLTAQYSEREFTFIGSGATSRDLIDGTLIIARALGNGRYHSPTFCGVCTPEERSNENALAKLSYFLSTERLGSHDLVAGYDTYDDIRLANNHQSGSDYRILGTTAIIRGTEIFPVFNNDGSTTIQYNPILRGSEGTSFKTNSMFVNDTWRYSERLTFNLGLRYDENDGQDAEGKTVAKDDNLSPRLAVTFDPWQNGNYVFHGSYGRYVAALANIIGDSTSSAGSPAAFQWAYRGPAINTDPNAPLVGQDEALRILFDWFNANGGPTGPLPLIAVNIPGGTTIIQDSLNTPSVDEYSLGVTARLGNRGLARVDAVHREWANFYATRTDLSTGQVTTPNGLQDRTFVENNDDLYERIYDGLHSQFRFNASDRLDFGGTWTWSHTRGNIDSETRLNGPVTGTIQEYPEYKDIRWFAPRGDLTTDQRHRVSMYGLYRILDGRHDLSVSLLQNYSSGRSYGALGSATLIDPVTRANYVTNPGYRTPPIRANYYFTGRDAFTTPDIYRTDIAFNYNISIGGLQLFLEPEVINVFNEQRVDTTASNFFDTSVLSADNAGACSQSPTGRCLAFNPLTERPVEGVHWQKGPNFGKGINPFAYQTPRTFRFSVGLRF
jgi:outer membrane receptor for ferrienterochelin and colicin